MSKDKSLGIPFKVGDVLQSMSLQDQLAAAIYAGDREYETFVRELINMQTVPEALTRQGGVFTFKGEEKKPWGVQYILDDGDGLVVKSQDLKGFKKLDTGAGQ